MANFQPPPTWANPVIVDEATGRGAFNPVWLKWFVDLAGVLNTVDAGSGGINHNGTVGKQGGTTGEFYHLSQDFYDETLRELVNDDVAGNTTLIPFQDFHSVRIITAGITVTLSFATGSGREYNIVMGVEGSATIAAQGGQSFILPGNPSSITLSGKGSSVRLRNQISGQWSVVANTNSDFVEVERVGTPTYHNLQHFINLSQSSGRISGGALTDAGSGNLNIAAGTGWVRITDDDVSTLKFFNWSASNGNAIPTNTARYVGVQYNSGSPQVVIKTTDTWDYDTDFPLGEVVNEGAAALQVTNDPWWVSDSLTNIIQRFDSFQKINRDSTVGGLILGETGTRNITVTAGKLWSRLNDFTFSAFNTSGSNTFDIYYRNGSGGFTKVAAQTQWPNTQYDDGSGTLVTMTNNRYANLWFYAETDGEVVMLYGQNQYTTASAAEVGSPPAALPARLQTHGTLIGRIIFQKSAGTATTVSSAFATTFNPVAATNHNLLSGLQGGAAAEFYHLTSAEYTGTGTGVFARQTAPTVTAPTVSSGNQNFSGTGQRITGDFSTVTLTDRLMLQTNVTNGVTVVGIVPNGTATVAAIGAFGASSPTNTTFGYLYNDGTQILLVSDKTGSGSYTPLAIHVGGAEALAISTTRHAEFRGTVRLQGYTVATLPAAGTVGRTAYVTDALAPAFNTAVAGGGAVKVPVFDNGTNWVVI